MNRLKKHTLGFWEVLEKPSQKDLQIYYAETYYQGAKGSYEFEYSKEELLYFTSKLEQRDALVKKYLSHLEGQLKTMIDVGCGEGYALSYFRNRGWTVKGIDFSSDGVRSKNPSCLDVLAEGDIFSLLKAEIKACNTYDLVWLQNVLEHVIDPLDLLKQLRTLVKRGGLAVITVPNDCSITQKAALANGHIDDEYWIKTPDHLSYFDAISLKNVIKATGWSCVEMISDFPVDWFLYHPGSNFIRDKSVGKLAHKARVQIENYIHQQEIDDVINFWKASAKLGLGRNITAFLINDV